MSNLKNYLNEFYTQKITFKDLKSKLIAEASINNKLSDANKLRFTQNIKDVEKIYPKTSFLIKENVKKVLKEADDTEVEYLDKISLFDALSLTENSLSEAFNSIYPFKQQYIDDPNLKAMLRQLRIDLSNCLNRCVEVISYVGLENDKREG